MSTESALSHPKALIITGLIVLAVVFAGSWYVSTTHSAVQTTGLPVATTAPLTPDPIAPENARKIIIVSIIDAGTTADGQRRYQVEIGPSATALQSIGLSLQVTNGTFVSSTQDFVMNPEIASTGWQAALAKIVQDSTTNSTMQLGFINLTPTGAEITKPLVLGEFVVSANTPSEEPEIIIDQDVSTVFAKDGSELLIDVRSRPL
ncbi:hypothetical protein KA082_01385 [Candidatus Woesebacteria bacterium]|nr:hypothetical protein [Candidatus Woesebacteria bacterium]